MGKVFILGCVIWCLCNLALSFIKYYICSEKFTWKDFLMQLLVTFIFSMLFPLIVYWLLILIV